MADPFIGEIRPFAFSFVPKGWATCDGQLLPIAQHSALFSLLGTRFGGNGQSTFALPDLSGAVPMGSGQAPGLSLRDVGEMGGVETVTLLTSEIPAHTHELLAVPTPGNRTSPVGNAPARVAGALPYEATAVPDVLMAPEAVAPVGGSLPHTNLQPYLTILFAIALQGVFPPQG